MSAELYQMRNPCKRCGHPFGYRREKNGQDVVRCLKCDVYAYCAPKKETGTPQRSVRSREALSPSGRAAILLRDGNRCVLCHAADGRIINVGHIVSVGVGHRIGLTDDELNDDENLAAMCEECNLGLGAQPLPLRLAVAILRARISWRKAGGAA